jgi:Matrixin
MAWFRPIRSPRSPSPFALHSRPYLEALESRIVPYALSGGAWPYPVRVTISFVPDGTQTSANTESNLFATFNARFGSPSVWQNIILKAAQVWAQQTNINFSLVSDNGTPEGQGAYQQGDPNMGDIRVSGYNFGLGDTDLAGTYYPPPVNNFSIAGDVAFNTAEPFNDNGQNYDLFTVAAHEMGHAIGLGESTVSSAVMFTYYTKVKSALTSDDIGGARAIYSNGNPRSAGAYEPDGSFSQAANITSQINTTSLTALITGVDVTTAGELEYYTFTVPSGTSGTMVVNVQSSELSLLAPNLTVYNSSQQQIGYESGAGQYGTTLSVTITGVSAGQQYYVEVTGADTSAFGTGAYALTLNFGTGANPTVPIPDTEDPNGSPLHTGGGSPQKAPLTDLFESQPDNPTQTIAVPAVSGNSAGALVIPVLAADQANALALAISPAALVASLPRPALPVTTASAASAPPSIPVVGSRVESGGEDEPSTTFLPVEEPEDSGPGVPVLPAPEVVPPGTTPAASDLARHCQPGSPSWPALVSKCFSDSAPARPVVRSEPVDATSAGQPALNHAAASAILLMALGSYWNIQAADFERPSRQPVRN